jgi:hypothetical protein
MQLVLVLSAATNQFAWVGVVRRWRGTRRRRGLGDDAGFGLLEVVIASTVMLTALTSMAYVTTNSFYDIAGAKQRQTAVALADEAIERARALPFGTIRDGNRTLDLAGDPRVLGAGTVASPYTLATTGERLRHTGSPQTVAPLVPNVSSRTVDRVVYAVRTYVSYFRNDPTLGAYTVTAYVDWISGGLGHRPTFVRATTVIFAPNSVLTPNGGVGGCPFATSEPFAGACPAALAGTSSIAPGQIRVNGSGSAGPTLVDAVTEVPTASASLVRGQVAVIGGTGKGGGLSLAGVPIGYPTSISQADDDPGTAVTDYESVSASNAATSASAAAGPGTVSVTTTATPTVDTSESTSAVRATNADPLRLCRDPAGTVQNDGLGCHRSVGDQGGTLRTGFDLTGLGLGTIPLSEVAPPPDPVVAYVKHRNSGACSASSVGCIHASASRSIGRVRVGGLPSVLAGPVGWPGYLYQLDNYADGLSVEAGPGAGAMVQTGPTGNFSYWSGAGYTTIALSSSSSFSVSTPVVTVSTLAYSVSVSSTIKRGPTSAIALTGPCLGSTCRTSSEAVLGAPLLATTTYSIKTILGVTIYQLTVTVDLGDLRVKATYVDPP